jgi:hypothetical protein
MTIQLSKFVQSTKAGGPVSRPPLVDPRYVGVVFPSPSMIPGKDADEGVLLATSEIRTLAAPLVASLKDPLLSLVGLCEKAHWLRMSAADAYVEKFDASRSVLIAGSDEAKGTVTPFGDPYQPRVAAAQGEYLLKMRKLLAQQVNETMKGSADALAAQVTAAVATLENALSAAELERAIPSLAKTVSADDEARINSIRRDLKRMSFEDMQRIYEKAQALGDPKRLDDLESAITPILDDFIAMTPTERGWKLKGAYTGADMREGVVDKMLGVCRSLRASMLASRESREPQDLELATGLAMKLRQTFNVVLGLPLGQLAPAQFSAIVDGGPLPPTSWEVAPGWVTRGLPAQPPTAWSPLVGWQNLGGSRRRADWSAGAAQSDRFVGLLQGA